MGDQNKQIRLDELLKKAVEVERASQVFYREGLEIAKTTEARNFLKHLLEDEENHERMLLSLLQSQLYDASMTVENSAELLIDESHDLEDFEWHERITIQDILAAALKREHQACVLFTMLSELDIPDEFKILFSKLAEEERKHWGTVETLFKASSGTMGVDW